MWKTISNMDDKEIALKLKMDNFVKCIGKAQFFIRVKDHKDDSQNKP